MRDRSRGFSPSPFRGVALKKGGPEKKMAAKFITIADLLASAEPSQHGMVRIIGQLQSYDLRHSRAWIQDRESPSLLVAVCTSNVEPFVCRPGTLYQFIGEVRASDGGEAAGKVRSADGRGKVRGVVMTALACRNMDGLDMGVYMKSHRARMKDLNVL